MARKRQPRLLADEITVTKKAVSVCQGYYQNPSGGLAQCLIDLVNQGRRALPRAVGTAEQRTQFREQLDALSERAESMRYRLNRRY